MAKGRVADSAVAHQLVDGAAGGPLQVGLHGEAVAGQLGWLGSRFQHEQPGPAGRLQRDFIAQRLAGDLQVGRQRMARRQAGAQRPPFEPVKAGEHRAAQVHLGLRRRRPVKLDAQRHAVVQRQLGHGANVHALAQAAAPGQGVAGQAPQRPDARKQHKQHQHDGRAQQRHLPGHARRLRQRWLADGQVGVDQRRQQAQQPNHHAGGRQQRLRVKKVAQHAKKAEEKNHEGIAPRAQFQRLERQQHHQQRHARVAPQQTAVRGVGGGQRQRQQQHQPGAAGQRLGLQRQIAAPQQQRAGAQAAPQRQSGGLRQQHPGHHQQQKQRVAHIARQRA